MVDFIGVFIGQELKAFDSGRHAGLLHKFKCYGISGQIFAFISTFCSNRPLLVILDGKSSQEYLVNTGAPQGPIVSASLFLLFINGLPDYVICSIAICADTTLYFNCDQAFDLRQELEMVAELEYNLRDTVAYDRKWLFDFNA